MDAIHLRQVYRAVRNSVQDAAVKLLTNVDAAQLATFSHVILTLSPCTAVLVLCCEASHTLSAKSRLKLRQALCLAHTPSM